MPIYYLRRPEEETRTEKLTWLNEMRFRMLEFQELQPDGKGNWLKVTDNDWDTLVPLFAKDTKAGTDEAAIFKLYSNGLKTGRDEWVIDWKPRKLGAKIKAFLQIYDQVRKTKSEELDLTIKWDRELTKYLARNVKLKYQAKHIVRHSYRPFVNRVLYYEKWLNMMTYQWRRIFPTGTEENVVIAVNDAGGHKPFHCLASKHIVDLHYTGDAQCLPRWRYEGDTRVDNITDWALGLFQEAYAAELAPSDLSKDDIFHYVYAVLHHPTYRDTYAQNLKRDFPRLPLYRGFRQWADWGAQLLAYHLNFDSTAPYGLRKQDLDWKLDRGPLPRLKALKAEGIIELDEQTSLHGVPPEAWAYQLGNRSALEWVLDQYKERTPKDPTIAAQFDTYRYADYKEEVITLLDQVCAVSVQTQALLAQMPEQPERVVRPS
jgi:predicted helicase